MTPCRSRLHTEGGVTITDSIGLPILLRHWKQAQPGEKWDEIYHNEVGGPVAVRRAGYNMAALQYFWRGHNFLDLPLTQRKCAVMLESSRRLFDRAQRKIQPKEVEENGLEHVTELHGVYMEIGGISCKGCMWGIDHAPFESMFTHHFVSPAFSYGEAKVYTAMDDALKNISAERGGDAWVSWEGCVRTSAAIYENGTVHVIASPPPPPAAPPSPPPSPRPPAAPPNSVRRRPRPRARVASPAAPPPLAS